jgi:hypothetical protein
MAGKELVKEWYFLQNYQSYFYTHQHLRQPHKGLQKNHPLGYRHRHHQ